MSGGFSRRQPFLAGAVPTAAGFARYPKTAKYKNFAYFKLRFRKGSKLGWALLNKLARMMLAVKREGRTVSAAAAGLGANLQAAKGGNFDVIFQA